MELSCLHRHVPARIPPQSRAWARALSGETHLPHRTETWKIDLSCFHTRVTAMFWFLMPLCLCSGFQNLPGVELHRQRFIWTHTESERQGQTENICCQSQSSV